jgi:hypothetical protein
VQPALERALAELVLGPPLGASELAALCARHGVAADDSAALAAELERWLVYRKLVQGTLRDAVALAIPRTIARLGALFDEYFARFLRENGPATHYLRDVTSELLEHCAPLWAEDARVPPWALDLARHEAMQIVVSSLGERAAPEPHGELELELDQGLRFVAAARVARYSFAVQRLSADEADRTPPAAVPTELLVYRDREHDVRYLELTPLAAALLERLIAGASLKEAVLGACGATQHEPATALDGTARLLADLAERGVLLGPAPAGAPAERLRAAGESSNMAGFGREKEPHERS